MPRRYPAAGRPQVPPREDPAFDYLGKGPLPKRPGIDERVHRWFASLAVEAERQGGVVNVRTVEQFTSQIGRWQVMTIRMEDGSIYRVAGQRVRAEG